MTKYGVTTVGRWLSEELPRGVKCYIEYRSLCFELRGVAGYNGVLRPVLRPLGESRQVVKFKPREYRITLSTQVVLSLDDELNGEPWEQVAQQLRPVAPDCWALNCYLAASEDFEAINDNTNNSLYCG